MVVVVVGLAVISSSKYFEGLAYGSETNPRFDLKFVGVTLWTNGVVPNMRWEILLAEDFEMRRLVLGKGDAY